jgi:hypothetical protein
VSGFLFALVLAFRAIRADDIVRQRWMIVITGLLDLPAAFGPAFWISFIMHALAAEL